MMLDRKKEMLAYIDNFKDMPDRLLKYNEILLEGANAVPYSYQDSMSYRRLAVSLTTRCNLACCWCYRLDPQYKSVLNKDLDFEAYRAFVKKTKSKFRMVHLAGLGEPTLYPKIEEVIRLSSRLSSNVNLTTNGVLLTPEKIRRYMKAGLTHIEVSIDAFDIEKLKKYRGADLNQLHDICRYISDKTILYLQINSVVSTKNYRWLRGIVRAFKDIKNIKVWHTIPLFATAQMRAEGIMPLENQTYMNILFKTEEETRKAGLKWSLFPSPYGVRLDPVIEMKKKHNICFTCFEDPYINVVGRFNFCSRQEYSSASSILEGFERAWNHSSLLRFRKNMLKGVYPEYCGKLCYLKDRTKKKGKR